MSAAPTTTQDRPPAPADLLRQIDTWLEATRHDADHPWRIAIAETLSAERVEVQRVGNCPGDLFNELAKVADGLADLLEDVACGDTSPLPAVSVACHLGWMADAAAQAHGHVGYRGSAEDWFLSSRGRHALTAARLAARKDAA